MAAGPGALSEAGRLLERLPGLVALLDGRDRIEFANSAFLTALGRKSGDVLGKRLKEVLPADAVERLREALATARDGGAAALDLTLSGPGGTLDVEAHVSGREGEETAAEGCLLFMLDVTRRRRLERRLAAKDAVTSVLADSSSLDAAAPLILGALCRHLGYAMGALWCVDEAAGTLSCVCTHGPGSAALRDGRTGFREGEGLLGEVWAKRTPVLVEDLQASDRFLRRDLLRRHGVRTMLAFPVVLQGEVLAVFELLGASGSWVGSDMAPMMAALGAQMGQFMKRCRAAEALRESEARLATMADSVPQLIWSARADGTVDFYSRRSADYAGIDQGVDGRWEWAPVVHPDDVEDTVAAWREAVRSGEPYEIEHRIRLADGRYRWHISRAVPVRDEAERIQRWYGSAADVHELRESQARLRAIFESVADPIAAVDREGRLAAFNPAFARLYGLSAEEAEGMDLARVARTFEWNDQGGRPVAPRDLPVRRALAGETVRGVEMAVRRQGAQKPTFIGSFSAVPVRNPRGVVEQVVISIQDVTERRREEERRRLLAQEVDHRARNNLAVVQAVTRLTSAETAEDFARQVRKRVAALARSHTRLSENQWSEVSLRELVRDELRPYEEGAADRASLEGPDLAVPASAVQSMSLVFHELATNAAKYGALSRPDGRVVVSWRLDGQDALHVEWREQGGPAVAEPEREGFGSQVIRGFVGQHDGRAEFHWEPSGLHCRLIFGKGLGVTRADAAEGLRDADGKPNPSASNGPGPRVLVAEDDVLLGLELCERVRAAGGDPIGPASSLQQAERLLGEEKQLDAALLDVDLGGEMVWPLADQLRARGVPLLFVSGFPMAAEAEARDSELLQKPVEPGRMDAQLARLVQRARRQEAS